MVVGREEDKALQDLLEEKEIQPYILLDNKERWVLEN